VGRCPLFVFEGDTTQLIDRIRAIAERVAASYGLEIFDVQFRRESQGWMLRIFLDVPSNDEAAGHPTAGAASGAPAGHPTAGAASGAPAGHPTAGAASGAPAAAPTDVSVSIQDCEQVSRDVGAILDIEEAIDHHYTLEVSSPGLDRPLRNAHDYRRFAGRLAKIVVSEAVDNQKHFAGRLQGLEDNAVMIETAPGKRHAIPLRLITRARLDVEF
jgi:ribosome maturation factor RimP